MDWAKPAYSKGKVDAAGRVLAEPASSRDARAEATAVVNNWRASHNYPLNTFKVTLRKKAQSVCNDPIVAQRIKRMISIEAKLKRSPTMRMSQMQDLGGCRVVLDTVDEVKTLVKKYQDSDLKHKLDDVDDYLEQPKEAYILYTNIIVTRRRLQFTTVYISKFKCVPDCNMHGLRLLKPWEPF